MKKSSLIFVTRKVLIFAGTLFVSFSMFFFFLRLIPGDPASRFIESVETQYGYMPDAKEWIAEYRQRFGLDQDLFTQYAVFLRKVFVDFDLGPSLVNFPDSAGSMIMARLPWTIGLLGLSVIIAWAIGLAAGTFVGFKRGGKFDSAMLTTAICVSQVPFYILALLLVLTFAYVLAVFPKSGAISPGIVPGFSLEFIVNYLDHAFLPALSIVLGSFFRRLLSARAMVVTILGEDYLLFAQAKGLKKFRILRRYVMRNTLLPQITGLALSLGRVVSGTVLVEAVFRYPGIGGLLTKALGMLDYNVIQGIVLLSMFSVLLANLLIDILYVWIDPRVSV